MDCSLWGHKELVTTKRLYFQSLDTFFPFVRQRLMKIHEKNFWSKNPASPMGLWLKVENEMLNVLYK